MLGGASWNEIGLVVLLLVVVMASSYVRPLGEAVGGLLCKRAAPPGGPPR